MPSSIHFHSNFLCIIAFPSEIISNRLQPRQTSSTIKKLHIHHLHTIAYPQTSPFSKNLFIFEKLIRIHFIMIQGWVSMDGGVDGWNGVTKLYKEWGVWGYGMKYSRIQESSIRICGNKGKGLFMESCWASFKKGRIISQLNLGRRRTSSYYIIFQTRKTMPQTALSQTQHTQNSITDSTSTKPCFEQQYTSDKTKVSRQGTLKIIRTRLTSEQQDADDYPEEESPSEVSLEQDLLDEHKMALEGLFLCTPILSQSQVPTEDQSGSQLRWKGGIFKELTLEYYLHHYLSKLKVARPALVDHFHSYLRQQKIFYRFLQHIYYSYPTHLVQLVLKYIIYTWELYSPYLKITLQSAQTQSAAQRIYGKMRQREQQRQLSDSIAMQEERRLVMKVIVTTVVLVMEKNFINPYCKHTLKDRRTSGNDEQSQRQQECNDILHKKVKKE